MSRKKLSKRLRFEVLSAANFACQYCGRSAPHVRLEVDHAKPVALGGTNARTNLVSACEDCNRGIHALELRPRSAGEWEFEDFAFCTDACWHRECYHEAIRCHRPIGIYRIDGRSISLRYVCALGHIWETNWDIDAARVHSRAVQEEFDELPVVGPLPVGVQSEDGRR